MTLSAGAHLWLTPILLCGSLVYLVLQIGDLKSTVETRLPDQNQLIKEAQAEESPDQPQTRLAVELEKAVTKIRKEAVLEAQASSLSSNSELSDPEAWQQHSFVAHGQHSFVSYAGYRTGPKNFAAIGLGALALAKDRKVGGCAWTSGLGKVIKGEVDLTLGPEHHDLMYQVLVFKCYLARDANPSSGGNLVVSVDGDDVLVYREKPGTFRNTVPKGPFRHNITHCSPPIYGEVNVGRLREWVEFHRHMGVDHIVIYDVGGLREQGEEMLLPYTQAGLVEITRIPEVLHYEQWYWGQVLIANECLYRFRYDSRWLLYLDFDEYLWLPDRGSTLMGLLANHEDVPYISFGSLWWSVKVCLPAAKDVPDLRWPIERMLWHWPYPYCVGDENKDVDKRFCTNFYGHRKLIVDPRKVNLMENHQTADPKGGGLDISTEELVHHHWQGLLARKENLCGDANGDKEDMTWWKEDHVVAEYAKTLRESPTPLSTFIRAKKDWETQVNAAHAKQE